MGSLSIWHWLIVLVIVLLLFGAGKIPKLMGDMAKGVKAFKSGLKEDEEAPKAEAQAAPGAAPSAATATIAHGEAKKEAPKV
ncbi:MAG: twin-arginine translocase TatA/TatE family subunit [Pseudomonadota bacterium]